MEHQFEGQMDIFSNQGLRDISEKEAWYHRLPFNAGPQRPWMFQCLPQEIWETEFFGVLVLWAPHRRRLSYFICLRRLGKQVLQSEHHVRDLNLPKQSGELHAPKHRILNNRSHRHK